MYGEPVIRHEPLKRTHATPVRHGLSTAETALGRVGRVGVGEHDGGVADSQVSPIARNREKCSNLPLRKAEEPSPSSSGDCVHVFVYMRVSSVI